MTPAPLPMNTFPPTTVGWEYAEMSPSSPKAHLSLSLRTWLTESRAASADWNRALSNVGLQPFHANSGVWLRLTARSLQNASGLGPGSGPGVPRYEATASRSSRRSG